MWYQASRTNHRICWLIKLLLKAIRENTAEQGEKSLSSWKSKLTLTTMADKILELSKLCLRALEYLCKQPFDSWEGKNIKATPLSIERSEGRVNQVNQRWWEMKTWVSRRQHAWQNTSSNCKSSVKIHTSSGLRIFN